jgi:hypothetical protein
MLNKIFWKNVGVIAAEILFAAIAIAGIVTILLPVYAKG